MIGESVVYIGQSAKLIDPVTPTILHFDFINGDDNNPGTALAPLKTVKQYILRAQAANTQFYTTRLDIFIHGDMGPSDILYIPGALFNNGVKYIHFVPNANQILHNGILTGVINYNQITNQWDEIQETGFDFTPYVGKTLVIQTGSLNGPSYCRILKAIALGKARVSWVVAVDRTDPYANMIISPALVGNTYQIWQLPKCYHYMEDTSPYDQQNNAVPKIIEFGDFSQCFSPTFAGTGILSGITLFQSCDMSGVYIITGCQLANILFVGTAILAGLITASFVSFLNCPYIPVFDYITFYGAIFQNSNIIMNSTVNNPGNAVVHFHHGAYGVAVFDCLNPFVIEEGGTIQLESPIWGQGNSGPILMINGAGRCLIDNEAHNQIFYATTSTVPEISIDGYTSLPAVDPVTFISTSPRQLSFANYLLSVAAGGFGQRMFNPSFPATCLGDLS